MTTSRILRALVLVAVVVCGLTGLVSARGPATFLFSLSNFSGPLKDDGVRIVVDREADETYVIYQSRVRIFGQSGMEIFSFGDDLDVGQIVDLAVDRDGSILLLSYKDSRSLVTRCSFRGIPLGPFQISHLPGDLHFGANRIVRRGDLLYFASLQQGRVIVADVKGEFRSQIDLMALVGGNAKEKDGAEIIGFAMDGEGSIYFTVPVLFSVYKRTADGQVSVFGRPGSAAGQFGVIAGVAVDDAGHVFVTDKLKCAVGIFDKNFKVITEFGYRGSRPENLIAPDDIALDQHGRIYVAQSRQRGVSVFSILLP